MQSSSVVDNYQTMHSSRRGKRVNHQCQGCFLKQSHEWPGHLLASKWPPANHTICSAKFHLVPVVTNFIHSGFYILPNQKVIFTLTLSHDCCVKGNAESDPSFHQSFLAINLQNRKKKYSRSLCQIVLWLKRHGTGFLSIPVYPAVTTMSHIYFNPIYSKVNLRGTGLSFCSLLNFEVLSETV